MHAYTICSFHIQISINVERSPEPIHVWRFPATKSCRQYYIWQLSLYLGRRVFEACTQFSCTYTHTLLYSHVSMTPVIICMIYVTVLSLLFVSVSKPPKAASNGTHVSREGPCRGDKHAHNSRHTPQPIKTKLWHWWILCNHLLIKKNLFNCAIKGPEKILFRMSHSCCSNNQGLEGKCLLLCILFLSAPSCTLAESSVVSAWFWLVDLIGPIVVQFSAIAIGCIPSVLCNHRCQASLLDCSSLIWSPC